MRLGVLPSALEAEGPEVMATLIDLIVSEHEEPDVDPSQAAWTTGGEEGADHG